MRLLVNTKPLKTFGMERSEHSFTNFDIELVLGFLNFYCISCLLLTDVCSNFLFLNKFARCVVMLSRWYQIIVCI